MPRALVVAPNWIGDAVMAQPLLAQLKSQGFEIDVLATPWVAPVFKVCAEVNQTIEADFKHGLFNLKLRREVATYLSSCSYDAAYVLPNSWKSAIVPWLAKIPTRIGYRGEMRLGLLNARLANPPRKNRPSMVKHYAALAALSPRSSATQFEVKNPTLQLRPNDVASTQTLINKLIPSTKNYFVLAPGAEYGPAKQWPLDHFSKLAESLLTKYPESGVLIIGGPKDQLASEQIIKQVNTAGEFSSRIKTTCGQISLINSIGLVSMAKGVASNDSGMMHIAAAFQVPQVAFFGSSDPKHTPPLSPFATPLWLDLDCSPCHKRQCPLGHLNCLKDISPESALTALVNQIIHKKG
jgi:heptosyltransferase-2